MFLQYLFLPGLPSKEEEFPTSNCEICLAIEGFSATIRIIVNAAGAPMIVLHPNCLGGGGGERVLWEIVSILLKNGKDVLLLSSPHSNYNLDFVKSEVLKTFGIELRNVEKNLVIIPLFMIPLLNSKLYPLFSIFLQAFAQVILGFEIVFRSCFWRKGDDFSFIDSFHLPFTSMIVGLFRRTKAIFAYSHFPFIYSSCTSPYHKVLLFFYQLALPFYTEIMVNSSFTKNELGLVLPSLKTELLYPPCCVFNNDDLWINCDGDKVSINDCNDDDYDQTIQIVSLSQFRPMKRHIDQIKIVSKLKYKGIKISLKMIGGISDDQKKYINHLKEVAKTHQVQLDIIGNATQNDINRIFAKSHIGLHTMHNEHFGIAVVDMISAGLLVMAHRSGGPLLDIIKDERFLFEDVDDCCFKLNSLLLGNAKDNDNGEDGDGKDFKGYNSNDIMERLTNIRKEVRLSVSDRFSPLKFEEGFLKTINKYT